MSAAITEHISHTDPICTTDCHFTKVLFNELVKHHVNFRYLLLKASVTTASENMVVKNAWWILEFLDILRATKEAHEEIYRRTQTYKKIVTVLTM